MATQDTARGGTTWSGLLGSDDLGLGLGGGGGEDVMKMLLVGDEPQCSTGRTMGRDREDSGQGSSERKRRWQGGEARGPSP